MKFIRNYEIRIKTPAGLLITIAPPFSAQIDVDRSVMSSVNNCNLTLYNLSPATRSQIFKDKYSMTIYWQMSILAGYGPDELYEIFRGNIQEAFSYKKNTEWITEITGYDGSYAIQNGFTSQTITKDVSMKDMIKRVIHDLPNAIVGVLGSPVTDKKQARGQVLNGDSYGTLQELTDNNAFIDNETVNVLGINDVIGGNVFVLDGSDGGNMLETPRRRDQYLEVTALFSPEIRIGHICEIRSVAPIYNGQYKVHGIKHSALISSASCGDATTIISLYKGTAPLLEVT